MGDWQTGNMFFGMEFQLKTIYAMAELTQSSTGVTFSFFYFSSLCTKHDNGNGTNYSYWDILFFGRSTPTTTFKCTLRGLHINAHCVIMDDRPTKWFRTANEKRMCQKWDEWTMNIFFRFHVGIPLPHTDTTASYNKLFRIDIPGPTDRPTLPFND